MYQRGNTEYHRSAKRRHAQQVRMTEMNILGMPYVLDRDYILKSQGLDPLMDAADYEQRKLKTKEDLKALRGLSSFGGNDNNTSAPYLNGPEYHYDISKLERFEMPRYEEPPLKDNPNGDRVATLLETQTIPQVIDKLIENYQPGDYPPMFPDIAHCDLKNSEMQALNEEFETELTKFALEFLRKHSDKVSRTALIEFAKTDTSASTFNRLFKL
jgi:hypothetical protein